MDEVKRLPLGQPTEIIESPPPSTEGGLRLPPFEQRDLNELERAGRSLYGRQKLHMTTEEVYAKRDAIFAQMYDFDGYEDFYSLDLGSLNNNKNRFPPFTIQRLCELAINPQKHYTNVGKYLRAVERSLLVTSSSDAFPPISADEAISDVASISMLSAAGSLREATTPLFSPIPFLHGDARSRSRSRSPPMSPLDLAAKRQLSPHSGDMSMSMDSSDPVVLEGDGPALGLVDELDDPSPGHLSDHPPPLSSTTTIPAESKPLALYAPLQDRFVRASASSSNGSGENGGPGSDDSDMVLDETDEDKENKQ